MLSDGMNFPRILLALLQVIGAISFLPYPAIIIASLPYIAISLYPFLWIVLFRWSWRSRVVSAL